MVEGLNVLKCLFFFALGIYLIGSRLLKVDTNLGGAVIKESDHAALKIAIYVLGICAILLGFYCLSL